jgi:adenosylcobinamide-GDP ribazoletransferase
MIPIFRQVLQQLGGAIVFYTVVPLPSRWPLEFRGMTHWAAIVGLAIGLGLGIGDYGLGLIGVVSPLKDVLIVTLWISITGGLHLDGVIDAADGLAVPDPEKRLAAMADSRTGAFGVMAAIVLVCLKVAALMSLPLHRWWVLPIVCGWGRWGQLAAIVRHRYLKPTGKGAFHQEWLRSPWQIVPMFAVMILLCLVPTVFLPSFLLPVPIRLAVGLAIGGGAIALLVGDWFNWRLGGQTGDTYGAIVEWSEALLLIAATLMD